MRTLSRSPFRGGFWVLALVIIGSLITGIGVSGEEPAGTEAVVAGVSTQDPYYGNLKVFTGPSTQSQVKGFVSNGNAVRLLETSGTMARITCGKFPEGGWVWGSYIKATTEEVEIPGGVTLPQLLNKNVPAPAAGVADKIREMVPKADKTLVASFIQQLPTPSPAPTE